MIDASWLGTYRHGLDEEDGIHTIRLSRDGDTVRLGYYFKCVNNHGYSHSREEGTVIAFSDRELLIEVGATASGAWEDLYKEFRDDKSTERYEAKFKIARIEDGRPVFRVRDAELTYIEPEE